MPVRIDDQLYQLARAESVIEHRTIAGQIEYWAMLGRAALDNPDLPVSFIAQSLAAMAEPLKTTYRSFIAQPNTI
ncbi:MAG: ParD-like family protein [Burkholderiaceae bacterium]